ncbi:MULTISPECIES: hypothetical protein [Aphanothece]|uniref:hypothetical protein n=1 Tax=Aphanothece TaxID=1121 RepID=UPI0039854EFB
MTSAPEDTLWFRVLLALRWPLALVASAAILGGVLLQVLSRPIPIRIALAPGQSLPVRADVAVDQLDQPLQVKQLSDQLNIKTQEVVTVRGVVDIASKAAIPISGQPKVVITSPVDVRASAPLPVKATAEVTAQQALPVQGDVNVKHDKPVTVNGAINVDGAVKVDTDDKPFKIEFDRGLMGIF